MNVGLSWLREHVALPADVTAEQLDLALNNLGIEVESIVDQRSSVGGELVVGRVLTVEELTEFKKPIRFCTLDVGKGTPQELICGASNFAVGDLVVVILPGGVLPGGFEVGSRNTYGRMSNGMICSARELGLGDDHAGIIVLDPSLSDKIGQDARPVVGLDDIILELELTPDRGYQMSVRGIARELASAFKVKFNDPGIGYAGSPTDVPAWDVSVTDPQGCDRFAARMVRGVDPKAATPEYIQRRLTTAGIRTLGLAIDITNYVMLELGQPMHAFDADRISGALVVRRARTGEKLTTLDGTVRMLSPEDMVICDDSGPISLAAVMGGQTSEVVDDTVNVLFEAAHWDPTMVGRTARRHKLFSEAAKRWERGVDRELCLIAIERAVKLLVEHGGGVAGEEILDLNHRPSVEMISMAADRPTRLVGVDYSVDRIADILTEIGCDVAAYDDRVDVVPPSWRPDLRQPADLVEEIVRIDGFDKVPSVLPLAPAGNGLTAAQRRRRSIGRTLAEQGYVEVLPFPFVSASTLETLGLPGEPDRTPGGSRKHSPVRLVNPISAEEPFMRTSLLPGLLATLRRNVGRGARDLALYEQGLVFHAAENTAVPPAMGVDGPPSAAHWQVANEVLPHQPAYVAAVLAGSVEPAGWWGDGRAADWADAIQAARLVLGDADVVIEQASVMPFHPGRCASISVGGTIVGHAGELHPQVCSTLELPKRTCAMELDLDAVPLPGPTPPPAVSLFPPALIDVALILPAEVPAETVRTALAEGAGPLLESVRLFDVYSGKGIDDGKRSLAFSLTFRAPDRTLTVDEAVVSRDAAVALATQRFGAVLRGAA